MCLCVNVNLFVQVEYFGLSYKTKKGHEWWLVLEKPIKKQLEQHASTCVGMVNLISRQALSWNPQGKGKRPRNSWRRDEDADIKRLGLN